MTEPALSRPDDTSPRQKLTVLILTRDEESCVARVIGSVPFADEVLVVDSGSTDRTVEIARSLGARVEPQPWLGWGVQHRKGASLATHDWVLLLDADEIVTPQLAASIRQVLRSNPDPRDGYVLVRQDEFMGRLMPDMRRASKRMNFVRLFNRRHGGWDPDVLVHEEIQVPGQRHMMDGPLLHWRNYSIAAQLRTLDRNSDLEAKMLVRDGGASVMKLVVKPLLRFAWIYIRSGCWRLGVRGFIWAGLHSFGEFLRQAKAWELACTRPAPHPPRDLYKGPLTAAETAPAPRAAHPATEAEPVQS